MTDEQHLREALAISILGHAADGMKEASLIDSAMRALSVVRSLMDERDALRVRLAAVEKERDEAQDIVSQFARNNPLFMHNGKQQDPCGAHDWLARIRRTNGRDHE